VYNRDVVHVLLLTNSCAFFHFSITLMESISIIVIAKVLKKIPRKTPLMSPP
jgi:hypothetical protein